jgi:DNA (cytosine-5)-methyltransferase 1
MAESLRNNKINITNAIAQQLSFVVPQVSKKLKFMDFCAGIGAGRLGLEKAGAKCVGYCEILTNSIKTYNTIHNTEKEQNFGDLTKVDIKNLPNFDIMIAGFPCQTFSINGQRKGFEDERGQIIYHLIEILKGKNVPYFILENVKGLVNHDGGRTLKIILQLLDDAGYFVSYKVLNSLDYGVPQMRERIYFVGIRKDKLSHGAFNWGAPVITPNIKNYLCDTHNEILDINDKTFVNYCNNKYNKGKVNLEEILKTDYLVIDTRQSDIRVYKNKVPTLRTGRHGILYVKNGKLRKLSAFESLLLQGFDKERAKKAIKNMTTKYLLEQTGNAMTVSVIELIAKSLMEYIQRKNNNE